MGILSSASAGDTAATTTPVLVSVYVAWRRVRLRLDGILRTVITLGCYRCAEPAAEGIFANFSLLLTEDPVDEPDVIDLGPVYEEDRIKFPSMTGSEDENDEDIDWDDRLHFPAGRGVVAGQGCQAAGNSQRPAEAYAEKMMMRKTVHM